MLGRFAVRLRTVPSAAAAVVRHQRPLHVQQHPSAPPSLSWVGMLQQQRPFHASATAALGVEEFRDPVSRQQRDQEPVGRSWSARELRRKSYEDLHKLWYVLYKERNMLLTERQLSRRRKLVFPQPERIVKVRKSMGAIRHVLGERKRAQLARVRHRLQQRKLEAEGADEQTDEAMYDMEIEEMEDEPFGTEEKPKPPS